MYNIGEVKIGQIVSSPQVFNYYYMSPNYNLKLSNLNPNATVDLKNFQSESHGAETIVHNMVCPSQNVIKLCENKTSLQLAGSRPPSSQLKQRKRRPLGTKTSSRKPKARARQAERLRGSGRTAKGLGLEVVTRGPPEATSRLADKPLTPSFFKKKRLDAEVREHLLSREPSCLNNSHQPCKAQLGGGARAGGRLMDIESSVSIPLNKSSVLFKEPRVEDFTSCTFAESPLIEKQTRAAKEMLYSSLAFSVSSSLDTSTKFLKLLPKEKAPAAKLKRFDRKKNLNKTSNMIKNKKDKIKRLKSQRKDQIRRLKQNKGIKGIKRYYNQVKQKSRKFSQNTHVGKPPAKTGSGKGIHLFHFSVRASKDQRAPQPPPRVPKPVRVEPRARDGSAMRKTTGLAPQPSSDYIERQLVSVQTSKVHTRFLENLFQEPTSVRPEQAYKDEPENVNIFKQRMSSNVDLNTKKYFLEEKHGMPQANRMQPKRGGQGPRKAPKKRGQVGAREARSQAKSGMRKNTSLDLVLKKKSIKFMGMRKEILKSIKKEVKNIYRLSSPSLKNFESSIGKYVSSGPTGKRLFKKTPSRKKSSQKAFPKQPTQALAEPRRRVTGSLDLKEVEATGSSVQKTFEDSLRTFKGRG